MCIRDSLNVEKARLEKSLANREIQALITALGTGIGNDFSLDNLRYGRVVIMSVDGEELTFVKDPAGRICAERVGPFIDWLWETGANPSAYQVICFDATSGQVRFKPCLLYTSDAAAERSSVDLGGRRII